MLDERDLHRLIVLKNELINDYWLLCSIALFLRNHFEFKYYFNKFSDTDKDIFRLHPTYKLFND